MYYKDVSDIYSGIQTLVKRVIFEDVAKLVTSPANHLEIERLAIRLAGSDEVNLQKLAGIIGMKREQIESNIDLMCKAELLNVLLPYTGIDGKLNKNRKAFFMSPSIRAALLAVFYGTELPTQFLSKLYEDTVVMYLKSTLTDGVLSFTSMANSSNPDFVVETMGNPILIELGMGKTSGTQLKKSPVKHRYSILVSGKFDRPEIDGNCLHLPLSWLLLL